MRIGILHNAYRFRGGEERVAEAEGALLERAGHHVARLTFDNRASFAELGSKLRGMMQAAGGWNGAAGDRVADWARSERLDVVHVHNVYPLLTGAGPAALCRLRVPVVMTLHNFRPVCAAGTFTRNGERCEDCLGGGFGSAIARSCYRGSALQTLSWAAGRVRAEAAGLWTQGIARFIAPSTHVRDTFTRAGFPASRIRVRPHFTDIAPRNRAGREGVVVVGRVEDSKGIPELVRRWPTAGPVLTVVGTGADIDATRRDAGVNVRFTGQLDRDGVAEAVAGARVLVSASALPETFGLTLAEAAACHTPAVAFAVGAYTSIIEDGVTGRLAEPRDMNALIRATVGLCQRPAAAAVMGVRAHMKYRRLYTPEAGLASLIDVYAEAQGAAAGAVA